MLENTGHNETKVPNTLALVAAKAVVEQARVYQERAREAIERQRAEESVRARKALDNSHEDAVQVSVGNPSKDAPTSTSSSTSDAGAGAQPQQPSRGTAVDLNA